MSKSSSIKQRLTALLDQYAVDQRPPTKPAERTRARILAAALDHFRRFGYRRASVDEIARAAHVAKGSVYVHFENKADLLLHAMAAEKLAMAHRFAPLFELEVPPEERLERYLEVALTTLPEMPLTSSLLGGDGELFAMLADLAPALRQKTQEQMIAGFTVILSGIGRFDGLPAAEKEARCTTLYSMLMGLISPTTAPLREGIDAKRLARTFAAIVVRGIGA